MKISVNSNDFFSNIDNSMIRNVGKSLIYFVLISSQKPNAKNFFDKNLAIFWSSNLLMYYTRTENQQQKAEICL